MEGSEEQRPPNGAAIHGQRPGVIYAFSGQRCRDHLNHHNLPASAWIKKLKVTIIFLILCLYFSF
jgi:hypothetical protein